MSMYKSASFRELQRAKAGKTGIGREGGAVKSKRVMLRAGIGNSRWNKGKLPKGAHRGGPIGSQRTGRK